MCRVHIAKQWCRLRRALPKTHGLYTCASVRRSTARSRRRRRLPKNTFARKPRLRCLTTSPRQSRPQKDDFAQRPRPGRCLWRNRNRGDDSPKRLPIPQLSEREWYHPRPLVLHPPPSVASQRRPPPHCRDFPHDSLPIGEGPPRASLFCRGRACSRPCSRQKSSHHKRPSLPWPIWK